MTKQEKIQSVYEELGFEWNICSRYITDNGVLILPTPDLKYSLKGYENLIKDENKFSAFGNEGLKIQPSALKGIFNNNGWTKIENEDDLPERNDEQIYYWIHEGSIHEMRLDPCHYDKPNVILKHYTHWKKKEEILYPIF